MGFFKSLKKGVSRAAKSAGKAVSRAASDVSKKVVKAADSVGEGVRTAADITRMVPGVGGILGAALDTPVTMLESGGLALSGDFGKAAEKMGGQLKDNLPALMDMGLMLATGGTSAIPTSIGGAVKAAARSLITEGIKGAIAPAPEYDAITGYEVGSGESQPVYSYDTFMQGIMEELDKGIKTEEIRQGSTLPYGPVRASGIWGEYSQNTEQLKRGL